jgi:4-amino-4-deoxy-L-arabinose transferase-like glycosyltransferase
VKVHAVEVRREKLTSSYGPALLALVLFFFFVGARWIWVYRRGQPLDVDEAGYLGLALINHYALVRGGVIGWLFAIEAPGVHAPLTTALASLLFYFTGPRVIVGFAVPLLAGTGCILATYYLGKSVGSRQIGLAASLLVASCPIILNYSRSFHFSLPATLVLTITLLALVNSNRFERTGWAVLFGLGLGLLPLARTMTIAFIPGVVAGAFMYTIAGPLHRLQRLLLLSASLVLAVLTAATWLGPNGSLVFHYLFSFGYGNRAVEYGPEHSAFSLAAWLTMLSVVCSNIYLPHLLVMVTGGVAILFATCSEALQTQKVDFLQRVLRSRMLPILIVIAEALLALTSSRNTGSAFFAPIVPPLLVVTAWAFFKISSRQYYRLTLALLLAAVAIVSTTPLVDLRTPLSPPWSADVPILGNVTVTDGRGTLQKYEAAGRFGPGNVAEPISSAMGKAWLHLDTKTANIIAHLNGPTAVMAFAFRHHLYNVNSLNLQHLLRTGLQFPARQVEPTLTGESIEGYLSWLAREGADACVLLTSDRAGGDFPPAINRTYMRQAAEQSGFIPVQQWPTPDGQTITLWNHGAAPPNCR